MAQKQNRRNSVSKDELDVMIFALRYAIGRLTYASQTACVYIAMQLSRMEGYQLDDILGEIDHMIQHHAYADDEALRNITMLRGAIKDEQHGRE